MLMSIVLCSLAPLKHSKRIRIVNGMWNGDVFWKWCKQLALWRLTERSTTAVSLSVFQVDPLFTVPAPPPPLSSSLPPQILPSYFSPSSSNIAAPVEQLLVRTRSVGVNTCEVGVVTEPECLGPCEPGTSVNLEGIVWHETEEGKYNLLLYISLCSLPVMHLCHR